MILFRSVTGPMLKGVKTGDSIISVDEGEYALCLRIKLSWEFLPIKIMDTYCAWCQVGKGPEGKDCTCQGPGKDGKARPLQKLSKIICACYVLEHSALGEIVCSVTGFSEVTDYVV